jgi:D-alanyl-D-alanine carboxypeptidase/D-alanyl-D-alanine-endopeptidase (penicillin-binding protein 4)
LNFILLLAFLLYSNLFAQSETLNPKSAINDLRLGINKIINDPFFERSSIAINIFDLTDSITLYEHNKQLLLHPASNMKILTSIVGLITLGKDYQFKTELYHTGVIDDTTLYGNLYVVGGFDPGFTIEDLDSLVSSVESLGIRNIAGKVCADVSKKDSLYWGNGWMWDDDPDPDAPYLSALNINGNTIEVFVNGETENLPAIITLYPETNYIEVINKTKSIPENYPNNFKANRDWVNRTNTIIIEGEVRNAAIIDSADHLEKINILYPERYFLTLFKEHLNKARILTEKDITIQSVPSNAVYLSAIDRSIDSVLADINKDSDNLSAEMLLYAIANQTSGSSASAEEGIEIIKNIVYSLGFNPDDYLFADGSGVSHYNLVSAELILEILKYIYYKRSDLFDLFYNSLSVAGVDGTLEKRMLETPVKENVHAKTGTLKGISTLSGYVTSKNGHLIAFSILVQNFVEKYSTARRFQDEICTLLANFE